MKSFLAKEKEKKDEMRKAKKLMNDGSEESDMSEEEGEDGVTDLAANQNNSIGVPMNKE